MPNWIFTHGDGDGLCSGALALAANPEAKVFFTHPFGLLEDLNQFKEGEKLIICDIALSEAHLKQLMARLRELSQSSNLIYVDHHPLPEGVKPGDIPATFIHDLRCSASELTYVFFKREIGDFFSRIAIFGAVADYLDNTPRIREMLKLWDKRTIYFETGVLVQGIEGRKRDYEFKRKIVSQLSKNVPPSYDEELLKGAIENTVLEENLISSIRRRVETFGEIAYILNPSPPFLGKSAIYAMAAAGKPIGVAGENRKGMIDLSVRTRVSELDLNRMLRRVALSLGGSGGGRELLPTQVGSFQLSACLHGVAFRPHLLVRGAHFSSIPQSSLPCGLC